LKDYICTPNPCLNGGTCVLSSPTTGYLFIIILIISILKIYLLFFIAYCACSFGFTGVICQTRIATTTKAPLNCVDVNPSLCQVYAAGNFCKNTYFVYGVTVLTYCPKSCNICSTNTTTTTTLSPKCSDLFTECSTWAKLYCKNYPIYDYCQKSCNLC
jgi:hypothetical protein